MEKKETEKLQKMLDLVTEQKDNKISDQKLN